MTKKKALKAGIGTVVALALLTVFIYGMVMLGYYSARRTYSEPIDYNKLYVTMNGEILVPKELPLEGEVSARILYPTGWERIYAIPSELLESKEKFYYSLDYRMFGGIHPLKVRKNKASPESSGYYVKIINGEKEIRITGRKASSIKYNDYSLEYFVLENMDIYRNYEVSYFYNEKRNVDHPKYDKYREGDDILYLTLKIEKTVFYFSIDTKGDFETYAKKTLDCVIDGTKANNYKK